MTWFFAIEIPKPGDYKLKLMLMSDSYMGVDQDPSFEVKVVEAMDVDESDEEEEEDDE